jgi:hypothetical protein
MEKDRAAECVEEAIAVATGRCATRARTRDYNLIKSALAHELESDISPRPRSAPGDDGNHFGVVGDSPESFAVRREIRTAKRNPAKA